jgi:hypothetical protein
MLHVWGEDRCIQGFGGEPEGDHLEDIGVEGRIFRKRDAGDELD